MIGSQRLSQNQHTGYNRNRSRYIPKNCGFYRRHLAEKITHQLGGQKDAPYAQIGRSDNKLRVLKRFKISMQITAENPIYEKSKIENRT